MPQLQVADAAQLVSQKREMEVLWASSPVCICGGQAGRAAVLDSDASENRDTGNVTLGAVGRFDPQLVWLF